MFITFVHFIFRQKWLFLSFSELFLLLHLFLTDLLFFFFLNSIPQYFWGTFCLLYKL